MATMIPALEQGGERPSSETRVLEILDALPEDWRVFHGIRFVVPPCASQPAIERELDVLLLHPIQGMLVLEVKGGGIEYDARGNEFTSVDKDGRRNSIPNPFDQASKGLHGLKQLIANRGWSDGAIDFVHGHAAVFPDVEWNPSVLPPGGPRDLVLDRRDLTSSSIEKRLVELSAFWSANRSPRPAPLGRPRLKRLAREVLAPHFALTPTLEGAISWDEHALLRLSGEQETCLEFLDLNPRAKVLGCAGSGKTLIAAEHARRIAARGSRVLLLCFNRPLAQHLRQRVDSGPDSGAYITVRTFHHLCREMWERAGNAWDEPGPGIPRDDVARFWRETSPRRLTEALRSVEERFEALVVDEAQDLETGWWEALHWTLVDPFETPVALFLDPAQDIYNRGGDFGLPLPTFPLRTNRRSTRAIVNFAARLGGTEVRHPYGVPEGEEPTVSRYASEQEERELVEGKVRWLLEDQRIPLARITLVGTRRLENSFLGTDRRLWHLTVEPMEDTGQTPSVGALRYSTVQRFKGLESEVVLLVDVDGHRNACSNVNLHVAASRARHRLYVFAHKEARLPTEDVARQ